MADGGVVCETVQDLGHPLLASPRVLDTPVSGGQCVAQSRRDDRGSHDLVDVVHVEHVDKVPGGPPRTDLELLVHHGSDLSDELGVMLPEDGGHERSRRVYAFVEVAIPVIHGRDTVFGPNKLPNHVRKVGRLRLE